MLAETTDKISLRRPTGADRRKFRRVIHQVEAKCLWKRGEEFSAQTVDMCGGGVSLKTDQGFDIGEELVIYVDGVGRMAGKVARATPFGFAISFSLVPHKREKVIDALTWIVNREALDLDDERKALRRATGGSLLVTYDSGVVAQCDVIDLSMTGVALRTTGPRPPIGSNVRMGSKIGRCARYVDGGFAVEFLI